MILEVTRCDSWVRSDERRIEGRGVVVTNGSAMQSHHDQGAMQGTKVQCATSTSEKCDVHLSKKAKARCTYLLLLNRLVDKERRAERGLLRDLLRLDRVCELGREVDVRDGDIVEDEIEAQRAACEVLADETGDLGAGLVGCSRKR